jgi:hypothetical protein
MAEAPAALPSAQEALRISVEVGHPYDESIARDGLARIWLEVGSVANALDEATAAARIEHAIGNLYGTAQTACLLCVIRERLGDRSGALEHARQAAWVFREIGAEDSAAALLAIAARLSAGSN